MSRPVGASVMRLLNKAKDNFRNHPFRSFVWLSTITTGVYFYETRYGMLAGRVPSPTALQNHLEYDIQDVKLQKDFVNEDTFKVRREEALKIADPALRKDLLAVIDREEKLAQQMKGRTMLVRNQQLMAREPHWEVRMAERNYSVMSRDQQMQQDHVWYRLDRSRDDDFGRNAYGSNK